MPRFFVIPNNDAVTHDVKNPLKCPCVVEVREIPNPDYPSVMDVWYYHRRVSIEDAMLMPIIPGLDSEEFRAEAA